MSVQDVPGEVASRRLSAQNLITLSLANIQKTQKFHPIRTQVFRLDALELALSVIATATWLAGWLGGCHTPVLYQNR